MATAWCLAEKRPHGTRASWHNHFHIFALAPDCKPKTFNANAWRYSPSSESGKKAGQPLAKGFKGLLWAVTGDLEYMCARLNLPHFNAKQSPCALCKCTGDGSIESWRDCRPNAKWTKLSWSSLERLGYMISSQHDFLFLFFPNGL